MSYMDSLNTKSWGLVCGIAVYFSSDSADKNSSARCLRCQKGWGEPGEHL